ncbi:MAG: DUF2605 domain-containing protein [Leptolyngbyaceae cyanobacterium bins.349]|nr:DUF2605 domain-containing protein [Leptolyngbyaceae cyanobacterium bins.349]
MSSPNSADPELLKSILEPLLDDFQYWFGRSLTFLESNEIPFMTPNQQADLLARVSQARQEVTAAQSLFKATAGQVGIEVSALTPWHHLVSECWQVANRFRQENTGSIDS